MIRPFHFGFLSKRNENRILESSPCSHVHTASFTTAWYGSSLGVSRQMDGWRKYNTNTKECHSATQRRRSCLLWQNRWNLKACTKWNKSDRKRRTVHYHLHGESKQLKSQKHGVKWWSSGARGWGKAGDIGHVVNLPVKRWLCLGDLTPSMASFMDSSVWHPWALLRE